MKTILIIISFFLLSFNAAGQIHVEGQLGGSNFLGFSVNAGIEIPISYNEKHFIVPSVGFGSLWPFDGLVPIIQGGLHYKYKNLGIGTEVSGFDGYPFFKKEFQLEFVDILVYPNLNYTFTFNSEWFLSISAGAYFAFLEYHYLGGEGMGLQFAGDVIPGGGLSFGHKF